LYFRYLNPISQIDNIFELTTSDGLIPFFRYEFSMLRCLSGPKGAVVAAGNFNIF
jgi:hypothetical protein